jgi:hypothetical protein
MVVIQVVLGHADVPSWQANAGLMEWLRSL